MEVWRDVNKATTVEAKTKVSEPRAGSGSCGCLVEGAENAGQDIAGQDNDGQTSMA